MTRISPLLKGLITGLLLIGLHYFMFMSGPNGNSLTYFGYLIYAGGIAWTLLAYAKSPAYTAQFGAIFSQGFRCFVIVTLVMIGYTVITIYLNPQWVEKAAEMYSVDLAKEGNKTPGEISSLVADMKKNYMTGEIYLATFVMMIMGCFFTAIGAGLLLMRRK